MEKENKPGANNQNQPNKSSLPPQIIFAGLSLLAIVGITVLVIRKKKRNN
jgi:LPXTG-motif cell wall-anchored protein